MSEQIKCPICGSNAFSQTNYDVMLVFYECPVCGRFQLGTLNRNFQINFNHLAPYLFHHCFSHKDFDEYRYHTILKRELCDKYKAGFKEGRNTHGHPVHMDADLIENWYPKTFSERVDYILMYLSEHTAHMGQLFSFSYQESLSLMFIDRKEKESNRIVNLQEEWRKESDCENDLRFMLDCLAEESYIAYSISPSESKELELRLRPKGYNRIDGLQKYRASGHNVLVAMKFGNETKLLREAIRKGIKDAQYNAIFIDEVQHNDFITPELLKYIRDSKFVVVDLTHQNNGAYFEEGYAMGLGKPVIQLCKKDVKLHFDIAQKNTIIWETENEIPGRLCNRILATID